MAADIIKALSVKEIADINRLDVSEIFESNGSANVTISNVAPAGVGTATISGWMSVIVSGTIYYIPLWT